MDYTRLQRSTNQRSTRSALVNLEVPQTKAAEPKDLAAFELGVDLGRALQVRLRSVQAGHLCFVTGKVELNRRVGWVQARCARQNCVGRVN
jgi:hypothetical protein